MAPRSRRKTNNGNPVDKFDKDLLRRIYEVMVLTRAVEDRMVAMYKGGDLLGSLYTGHWHEGDQRRRRRRRCGPTTTWPRSTATWARTCGAAWSRGR